MSADDRPAEYRITEVTVDERGRVSLGRTGLTPGRYRVEVSESGGVATLRRVVSVIEGKGAQ